MSCSNVLFRVRIESNRKNESCTAIEFPKFWPEGKDGNRNLFKSFSSSRKEPETLLTLVVFVAAPTDNIGITKNLYKSQKSQNS